jgi:protease II
MAYKQAKNRRKKLLKTYKQIEDMRKHYTGSGVWYDEDRGFYYKYTASNTPGYAKLLRKRGNKKVRQSNDILNYSDYRRVYDYKWTLL